jgi:hypothetical protein
MTRRFRRAVGRTALAAALAVAGVAFTGCEQKEKVLEVKTPNKRIEVERSKETGNVDVKTSGRHNPIQVETPKTKVEVERSKDGGLPRVEVQTHK